MKYGVTWCCLEKILEAAKAWMGGHILWRMLPFVILWSIWRERKDKIFKGDFSSLLVLINRISMRIAKWALIRKECSNFSLNDFLLNWEVCMGCRPSEVRRVVLWSPPSHGVFKFNVDGATRGKPGLAGI